ncbi:hypothetical protein EJ05DRAFT_486754 [Pseudovirgaria hyperparasitica]|uniref:Uncharacterized protein n=1 Tax=Pseudovirgaria hyperparasitica TaxID=470096 RepID=A0A6A6W563_9PEZI|nr:uncharacterized protein EJ05DRAFT_486754 [Pseudovirgaria hyperparasitica]KAF2757733.1 hypothetical protein EJ05DRAFT_486754 [Pseudovirgaria hyperparasitica]
MPSFPFVVDGVSKLAVRGYSFGAEYLNNNALNKRGDEPPKFPEMPAWGAAIIGATALFFVFFLASIQYTIGDVISTLAMIETPAAEVTFTESDEPDNTLDKEQKEHLLETSPTVTIAPIKPITSNIRGTIKHLRSQAGRTSRWRGIVPAVIYSFLVSISFNLVQAIIPGEFGLLRMPIVNSLAALPLARLHMAWTHAMISQPSNLRWYQRIQPLSSYKQLWLPTIVSHSAAIYAVYATGYFAVLISQLFLSDTMDALTEGKAVSGAAITGSILSVFAIFFFAVFAGLFIVLPAHVTLVRIEASLLPEDQDTIVPFDRSFGGKVVPKVLGGSGAVGFLDAWKTFNWEARRRLIKLYVKNAAIQMMTVFTFVHLIAFEALAIMGKDIKHYMCKMNKYQKEHSQ